MIVGVYVDDLIVTGSNTEEVKRFKEQMMMEFEMSDLGPLSYYLGIEVEQQKDRILLKQLAYAKKVLSQFGMADCNTAKYPMEPKIIVESIGEGVTELAPGDHILPVFIRECKDCAHCKSEESKMSTLLRINTDIGVMIGDGLSRFLINGKPIYHFVRTSTFSKCTVIHVNVAKPPKGSLVVVFGLGAINLVAAEGARIAGASRIIGVDVNPRRFLEDFSFFCVNEFVNPKDYQKPFQEVLAEMTDGGVDRSIKCTSNIDAMILAFECVHDGWSVAVLVRVPHKDAVFKTHHPMNVLNEITLKGTFFGNCTLHSDLPVVVERYMNKELELEKFITHEVPFFRFPASLLPNKISLASGLRPVLVVHTK
ncbi:LOW QUALITY PROTEIN: alcohol dehydrogenase 1-like [Dioscorea cayenensis subsp. rotundata]|uniref:alcohol dehydrogenase n=1 Tax=Dioscorea cayennensis subsp. rotundata TaxID=55577 RepID=A0AB40CX76_DIOCR|nr:LOW QUALITY PROTEIN: alcohol dehydrogenase 1-like [Dioscorea cayenensis subsp. rotundata]